MTDQAIIDVLGIEPIDSNPYWKNRNEIIKEYRKLEKRFEGCEMFLKGEEPYWSGFGHKIKSAKYLDVIRGE